MKKFSKSVVLILAILFLVSFSAAASSTARYTFNNSCPPSDSSGNSNNGTCQNSPTTGVTGKWSNAYSFDGSNNVVVPSAANPEFANNWSVNIWYKSEGSSVASQKAVFGGRDSTSGDNLALQFSGSDDIHLIQYDGSGYNIKPSNDITDTSWHMITVVQNSTNTALYIDSNLQGMARNGDLTLEQEDFWIAGRGGDGGSDRRISGDIDEFRMFSSKLTSNEIYSLYSSNNLSANSLPSLSNPQPPDGATGVSDNTTLSIDYSDADSDQGTVTFYYKNGTQIYQENSVATGSTVTTNQLDLKSGTTYEWYAEASDAAGSSFAGNYSFQFDNTAPASSDNWTATGYVSQSSVSVELTATDSESSISNLSYRVDGNSYTNIDGSSTTVTISGEGNHTLEYYAYDTAGNKEAKSVEYVALKLQDWLLVDTVSEWNEGTYSDTWNETDLRLEQPFIDYTGTRFNLTETYSSREDAEGIAKTSNDNFWISEDEDGYLAHQYNSNGAYTGKSIDMHQVCDGLYSASSTIDIESRSGSYIYTAGLNVNGKKVVTEFDISSGNCTQIWDVSSHVNGIYKFKYDKSSNQWLVVERSTVHEFDTSFNHINSYSINGYGDYPYQVNNINGYWWVGYSSDKEELSYSIRYNPNWTVTQSNISLKNPDGYGEAWEIEVEDGYSWILDSSGETDYLYKNHDGTQKGRYLSKNYDAGSSTSWNSIKAKMNLPSNSNSNITVQTSTNDFSTVEQEQQVEFVKNGSFALDQLTTKTQYVRFNVSMDRGVNTPKIDLVNVTKNQKPLFRSSRINWQNIGGSLTKKVLFNYSDSDDISGVSSPSSGSLSSSNSSATVLGWSSPFNWEATARDVFGLSSSKRSINFTATEKSIHVENNSGVFNESHQTLKTVVELEITGDASNYSIGAANPDNTKKVVKNANITSSSSLTGTVSRTWYWYVDQVISTVYSERQDTSKNNTLSSQRTSLKKQIHNSNSPAFSSLSVTPPTLSGNCSNCSTRTISLSDNNKTNETYNASGDFIKNKNYSISPQSNEVTLGTNYLANEPLELNETAGINWSSLNSTGAVHVPSSCSQTNNSIVNISSNVVKNISVGLSCNPGSVTNSDLDKNDLPNNVTQYQYNGTLSIATNITQETRVVISINETVLLDWDKRNTNTEVAYVNDSSSNISIVDGTDFVYIQVGTEHGNSSLHKGSHDFSLRYKVEDDKVTQTPTGGVSAGRGEDEETELAVKFEPDNPYTASPEATTRHYFTVKNRLDKENSVQLEELTSQYAGCQYINIQKSVNNDEFGDSALYTLANASTGFDKNFYKRSDIQIRVVLPPKPNITGVKDGLLQCGYKATATKGTAEDLLVTVRVEKGVFDRLNDQVEKLLGVQLLEWRTQCFGLSVMQTDEACSEGRSWTVPFPTAAGGGVLATVFITAVTLFYVGGNRSLT